MNAPITVRLGSRNIVVNAEEGMLGPSILILTDECAHARHRAQNRAYAADVLHLRKPHTWAIAQLRLYRRKAFEPLCNERALVQLRRTRPERHVECDERL